VRALVLYTQGAANYGNINSIISQAIQETNDAYGNSNSSTGNVILQHSQLLSFNESIDIDNDLNIIMNSSITKNLRNQYDADVVILLTQPGAYLYAGVAGTITAENSKAYAIVDVSYATGPRYTFAHELGHIQGLQHHPSDPVGSGLYPYGFVHRISYSCGFLGLGTCKRSTIMAYTPSGYSRIKYFSNPNKTYNGASLGIANQRENYRVLNNTRVTVANFRNANEPYAAISYVAGATSQYGQNFTFSDNSCGGNGSLSYEWRVSFNNPTNFGGVQSTSSSYFVALNPVTWYVQLNVTSSTGQTSTKVVSVLADDDDPACLPPFVCDPGGPIPKVITPTLDEIEDTPETVNLLPAYPNPFNPTTTVSFQLPETINVKLTVYDLSGREIAILADQSFSAGSHQLAFDGVGLSSGTYILRLQAGNEIRTQTIMLIK
jgi:hypothetical protein